MNNAKYGLISNVQRYKKRKKYEIFASEKTLISLIIIDKINIAVNILEIVNAIASTFVPAYKRDKTVGGKIVIPKTLR
jgi:hypothetical protein